MTSVVRSTITPIASDATRRDELLRLYQANARLMKVLVPTAFDVDWHADTPNSDDVDDLTSTQSTTLLKSCEWYVHNITSALIIKLMPIVEATIQPLEERMVDTTVTRTSQVLESKVTHHATKMNCSDPADEQQAAVVATLNSGR
jgi:hypothetical protein